MLEQRDRLGLVHIVASHLLCCADGPTPVARSVVQGKTSAKLIVTWLNGVERKVADWLYRTVLDTVLKWIVEDVNTKSHTSVMSSSGQYIACTGSIKYVTIRPVAPFKAVN